MRVDFYLYPNLSMIRTNGIIRNWGLLLLVSALCIALYGGCDSSQTEGLTTDASAVFYGSDADTWEAPGYACESRIELTGKPGTSYTVTVTEGGSW